MDYSAYLIEKDIRNLIPLKKEQLEFIKTLPKEKLIEFIEIFNLCIDKIQIILED